MTIGIARKFGSRVIILTDTMISGRGLIRPNAIPGRLKAIVLSPTVSVAYAGHADPALYAVRRARKELLRTGSAKSAGDVLAAACSDPDCDLEFILVSHAGTEASLRKVTKHGVTTELNECYIGDSDIVRDVLSQKGTVAESGIPEIGVSAEESEFGSAFLGLFTARGTQVGEFVGGLPINLLASPYGHTYQAQGVVTVWDPVDLSVGVTAEHQARYQTGHTKWAYSISTSRLRGVGVVGAALPQIGTAFVYAPIKADDPEVFRVSLAEAPDHIGEYALLDELQRRIEASAECMGGGVDELVP